MGRTDGAQSIRCLSFEYLLGERNGLGLLHEAVMNGCKGPMILLTGKGTRDVDMAAMNAGASDYLDKSEIEASLLERSIRYAIEHKRAQQEREQLISELREALSKVKKLSGLLPMCASCKKIRDDKGYWNQLEANFVITPKLILVTSYALNVQKSFILNMPMRLNPNPESPLFFQTARSY